MTSVRASAAVIQGVFNVSGTVYGPDTDAKGNLVARKRTAEEYPENQESYINDTIFWLDDMINGMIILRDQMVQLREEVSRDESTSRNDRYRCFE